MLGTREIIAHPHVCWLLLDDFLKVLSINLLLPAPFSGMNDNKEIRQKLEFRIPQY